MKALHKLLATPAACTPTLLRLTLGIVFFPHGAQKVLGWFGGYGFSGTMGFFTNMMHIPALFAALAIAAEFLGALGLIFGAFTRIAAAGIVANMLVAIAMVHIKFGFFMNWYGNQKGEGIEYHILVIGIALALIFTGGGNWSMDQAIARKLESGKN